MGKDYYKTLGVDKSASADEIKKAFRAKAHQCHPDKQGGDEAKFKELNEAYQVLGDVKKRSQYDQFGSTFEQAQAGGGFGGFDGFRDFSGYTNGFNVDMDDLGDILGGFGDMFGFGRQSGGRGTRRASRGRDLELGLAIDFMEAVTGANKDLGFEKKVVCDRCHGDLAEPGSKIETCKTCNGSGRVTRVQRTILGNMQVQTVCGTCSGEGKTYSKLCTKCNGRGAVMDRVNITVKVPAGINDGESIRLTGQGEAGEKGAPSGDLYLRVKVRPDPRFKRDGYDIRTELTVSFTMAALGGKIEVETVEGPVTLKVPAGTQPGTVFKLRGKGMTRLQASGQGDHFVTVQVKVPTSLSREQKRLLEDAGL